MVRALVPTLLVAVGAGCGQAVVEATTPAAGRETARVTLYFLAEDGAVALGVRRDIIERTPPPWGSVAGGALEALLIGPTAEEAATGLTTAIPSGARLISLRSRGDGGIGAVVNLSGLGGVDDGIDRARVIAQIVRTLVGISYSSVEHVWLREDGKPWGMYLMDGGVYDGPYDYSNISFHVGASCPGTETVVCDRFDGLP
jgi:spore germination protein GerM